MSIDRTWLTAQVATVAAPVADSPAVHRVRGLLQDWAIGFSEVRADVASPTITWPRRGILDDESSSFLRALDSRQGTVAAAGRCSWHGRPTCEETPVISFQDAENQWQSGCQRALDELVARGEITAPEGLGAGSA